jgi:hypothetical protein
MSNHTVDQWLCPLCIRYKQAQFEFNSVSALINSVVRHATSSSSSDDDDSDDWFWTCLGCLLPPHFGAPVKKTSTRLRQYNVEPPGLSLEITRVQAVSQPCYRNSSIVGQRLTLRPKKAKVEFAFLVFWRAFGFGRITAVVLVFAIVFTKSSFEWHLESYRKRFFNSFNK